VKTNRLFNKNNIGKASLALIAILAPIVYMVYLMNDYEYSLIDARTSSFTSDIEVLPNGDVRFEEVRGRYINYGTIEQSLYFAADDEDVSSNIHEPEFDTANFANRVYDRNGTLLISGDGTAPVNIYQGYERLYLTYSWLTNPVNELGDPFLTEDNQSVNLLHYNSNLWNDARFEYDYTIKGVALEYADTSEFFWTVATTDYMRTSNVRVSITLPGTDYEPDVVKAYVMGANRAKIESIAKNADDQIVVTLYAAQLYPGEFIATRINFPASALSIPNNTYGNIVDTVTHLPNVARYQAEYQAPLIVYRVVDIAAFVILGIFLAVTAVAVLGIYKKYDKERTSAFYGEYYRELPADYGPAMMGYLYRFKEITKDDVSATLMDLIRKGYVEVETGKESLTAKNANYTLRYLRAKDQSELQEHEKQLLKWFFDTVAAGDTLTLKQLEDYNKTEIRAMKYMAANNEFNFAADREARKLNFFDDVKEAATKGKTLFSVLLLVGIALAATRMLLSQGTFTIIVGGVLIAMALLLSAYTASIERRSLRGHEDYVRWQAFEKFLKEFSNIKDYPMPGIVVWEHYMVYAVSFGIADLVEKQLRYKYKQLDQEEVLRQSRFFRYPGLHYYYWHGINRSYMRAQATIQAAQAARNAAKGGGGRFGGGGGFHIGGGGSGVRLR